MERILIWVHSLVVLMSLLRYVTESVTWETNAHTEASAQVIFRSNELGDAQNLLLQPFMRISAVKGSHRQILFLGMADPTKGSIYEEGVTQGWLVEVAATTMLRRASRNFPTFRNDELTSNYNPEQGNVRTTDGIPRFTGPRGEIIYQSSDLLINHLRANLYEVGPMLFADPREWPTREIYIESGAKDGPLSYTDIAQTAADSIERGWQLAPDGFLSSAA